MRDEKIAIVTGKNSGIGKAVADLLTSNGVHTIICGRREEESQKVVKNFSGRKGRIIFKKCDLSSTDQIQAMFSEIEKEFGRLDYAVNNAGIGGLAVELHKYPEKVFDKLLAVNIKGLWNCMRFKIPLMLKNEAGSIVNIFSIAVLNGADWLVSSYSATKHAVIGLTKSASLEYATKNIRINAVCPGFIMTEMLEGLFHSVQNPKQAKLEIQAKHPINRIAEPLEVAKAVLFLLSEGFSFITGIAMPVDRGYSTR